MLQLLQLDLVLPDDIIIQYLQRHKTTPRSNVSLRHNQYYAHKFLDSHRDQGMAVTRFTYEYFILKPFNMRFYFFVTHLVFKYSKNNHDCRRYKINIILDFCFIFTLSILRI